MAVVKVSVLEVDGEEYDTPTERLLNAEDAFINTTGTEIAATNAGAAIREIFFLATRFSVKKILITDTLNIPLDSEMVVTNYITVDGVLDIFGELSIL